MDITPISLKQNHHTLQPLQHKSTVGCNQQSLAILDPHHLMASISRLKLTHTLYLAHYPLGSNVSCFSRTRRPQRDTRPRMTAPPIMQIGTNISLSLFCPSPGFDIGNVAYAVWTTPSTCLPCFLYQENWAPKTALSSRINNIQSTLYRFAVCVELQWRRSKRIGKFGSNPDHSQALFAIRTRLEAAEEANVLSTDRTRVLCKGIIHQGGIWIVEISSLRDWSARNQ